MKIKTESSAKKKTQLLCCFVLENSNKTLGLGKFDAKTSSSINQSLKDMQGKFGKLNIQLILKHSNTSKMMRC